MAATLVTVERKAGRLTADQTLCMSGRAGSFASQELVAEGEHAPRHRIDNVSVCRSRQGRSFGEDRSHLVLLGFDAAQNLVLFHRILTDLS